MGRSLIIDTLSAEETIAYGKQFALEVEPGAVVCLFGELGAGKTTFMKGFVSALSDTEPEEVCSPTFSYLNIYEGTALTIYHFDLYRLSSVDEFLSMGFEEYLFGDGVCCLEWSERITPILPAHTLRINLSHSGEGKRKIQYEIPEC